MIDADHANGKLVYCAGGICGLLLGISYLVIIALYAPMGAPPVDVTARLVYLATNTKTWWWVIGLSVLTDLLFVPVTLSLYFALKQVNRYLMMLAAGCVILFVFLDLAITWTNYTSLMTLSAEYVKAETETQRANIVAAAEVPCAVLQSSLLFVYNSFTLALGILLMSLLMPRAAFGKPAAYLGIASGSAGILSVAASLFVSGLSPAIILASCLTTLWVLVVGWKLAVRGISYSAAP